MKKKAESKLKIVKDNVKKVLGVSEEADRSFKTGVVLLSAVIVGPNVSKISSFTGYTRKEVGTRIKVAREQGIVTKDNKLAVDWFGKDGGIALMCDCLVVDGMLAKV